MKSSAVTVTTTPTLIVAADDQNRYVYLQIENNKTIYVGGDSVSTSTGIPYEKHSSPHTIFLPIKQTMFAVVTAQTATAVIYVMTPDTD